MIFWQDALPLREAVWLGEAKDSNTQKGHVFLLMETRYQERTPLNPLSGTTYKRSYRTKLAVVRIPRDWPAGRSFAAAPIFAGPAAQPRKGVANADGLVVLRLPDHAGWLLAESLVRRRDSKIGGQSLDLLPAGGFWITGNAGDAYGGPERWIYHVDGAGQLIRQRPGEAALEAKSEAKIDRTSPGSPAGRRLYHDDALGNFVLQID